MEQENKETIKEMQGNGQQTETKKQNKGSKLRRRLIVLFVVLVAIIGYVIFRGDYLEMMELGPNYVEVFWTGWLYKGITFGINFVFLFIVMYFTTRGIKKGLQEFFEQEKKEMPKLPNKSISFVVAVLVSLITMGTLAQQGMLMFSNAKFGGNPDPVFGQDIGFYFFQKPFIEGILLYLTILAVGVTIYTAIYYIIAFNVYFDGIDRQMLKRSRLVKQLLNNIRIIAVLIAALVLVNTRDIMTDKMITLSDEDSTVLYGAGLTDVTIKLWGYYILAAVIILSVFMAVRFFKQQKTKKVIISLAVVPGYLVVLFITMSLFQAIFVSPNELDRENQYIAQNIESTKSAYNINIEEITLENTGTITADQIAQNRDVVNNIAIVDENTTLTTLQEQQTNSNYYTYRNTQIGKYDINGQMQLVYVSPREITSGSSVTYNNKTYEYTHGMGAVITSATSTDDAGNVEYIQKSFDGSDNQIEVTQPRIYFGMDTNESVVTNSKTKSEYDYPTSETENTTYTYDGTAGLQLNFYDRLILGIKQGNLKLAFSGDVTNESKILINRNILERVKAAFPYILYDEEPYQVITDEGKLVWVIDGYTVSDAYPYSQTTTIEVDGSRQRINYIRNSVKVIVDSYDGTMKFYITDRNDPIIMAYNNLYPSLFEDKDTSIPEDIAKHIVYPKYLYEIQAEMLERYHAVKTDVLYRSNDVWEPATHTTSRTLRTTGTPIEPYYTMVKTVDNEEAQLGLVLPYTLYEKQSLISYLVGTCDEEVNGKLTLYKYATDSNVLGPMQLDTQIEQDEEISNALETLNVSGTSLIRNLIMVPIDNSILYIEPIYQVMLNDSESPVLRRVIAASGNKVAIGNNLTEALNNLISQSAINIEVTNTDSAQALIESIIRANENLQTSQESGDWELIGRDIKELQELVTTLQELMEEEEKEQEEDGNNTITNEMIENEIVTNAIENTQI